ncbi:unnamed protein product (macronuclear) [Paramecium tetraurelia]|uniref:DUF8019 domain-containing protein n=1 Tax=Paramecium tetraurelia TaxID=5888 RepID=A0C6A9_PARTE|nr:uncharacterized protein GSPATT00035455001 [Paramecium tetraurelia]CAK66326.1 unnamed protein product [Paramecium tetraurelia]|eukprot:XP_001433723.1 hypothetical protein (macronuclear) [Paramecium tetraurelia strain d4-2]
MLNLIFILVSGIYSQEPELCYKLDGHLCVNNQIADTTFVPLDSTIGLWRFDKNQMDDSQLLNHLLQPCELGPGRGAVGNSAYYSGEQYSIIPHHDQYHDIVTISMWIYPLSSQQSFTTILRKALKSTEYTPTILLWPFHDEANVGGGQIEVIVSTSYDKENLRSKGSVTGRKWNHLAIVLQGLSIDLYINGIHDNVLSLKARPLKNDGPFYVGGDPWFNGPLLYLDDLTFYNIPFLQLEISKLVNFPGQVNNRLFYLGCDGCNYHQSLSSCKQGWHLCSLSELTSGIYMHARQNGWLRLTKDFWSRVDEIDQELAKNYLDPQKTKAAICCSDSFY